MKLGQSTVPTTSVTAVLNDFFESVITALPQILAGLLFLAIAVVAIKTVTHFLGKTLKHVYPENQHLIANLIVTVVSIFLWFAATLALFKIVGMGDVATSLGSTTGFIGLGVTYALKDMLADTVAGVYLLKDPNFHEGDTVETASVTGTVEKIDLRKTRITEPDGDLVVVANGDVEKRWTQTTATELQSD
jgi:small-conductance mechanosensitive channel